MTFTSSSSTRQFSVKKSIPAGQTKPFEYTFAWLNIFLPFSMGHTFASSLPDSEWDTHKLQTTHKSTYTTRRGTSKCNYDSSGEIVLKIRAIIEDKCTNVYREERIEKERKGNGVIYTGVTYNNSSIGIHEGCQQLSSCQKNYDSTILHFPFDLGQCHLRQEHVLQYTSR